VKAPRAEMFTASSRPLVISGNIGGGKGSAGEKKKPESERASRVPSRGEEKDLRSLKRVKQNQGRLPAAI